MLYEPGRRVGPIVLVVIIALAGPLWSARTARGGTSAIPPFAWNIETADATEGSGLYTSIALDSESHPYISYVNEVEGTLRVATRINGTWTSEIVAGPGTFYGDTNVVVGPNHTIEVSYYDADSNEVMYGVREPSGWRLMPVDTGFSEGYNRLALNPAGQPAIAYTSFDGFLRYASWNGSTWVTESVDNQTLISRYEDLAFDPLGDPHISYFGNGTLLCAVRTDGGWTHEVVDPTESAGEFSRIRFDSLGVAHIAYYVQSNRTLMYATEGAKGWALSVVDSEGDDGYDLSLALDAADRAQLAYYQRSTGFLRYAIQVGNGWLRETVDTGNVVGWYTGIAVDAFGLPHISYYSWGDSSLRYATGEIALQVRTLGASVTAPTSAVLRGELVALGNNSRAAVGFAFRPVGSLAWTYLPAGNLTGAGTFTVTLTNLTTSSSYEFQAVAFAGTQTAAGATLSFRPAPLAPHAPSLLLPGILMGAAVFAVILILVLWRRRRRPKSVAPHPMFLSLRDDTPPDGSDAARASGDLPHRKDRHGQWGNEDGSGSPTEEMSGSGARPEALGAWSAGCRDPDPE